MIGSRIGGIPEGIAEGETGFLAPEKDAPALARAIGDLLDDPAMRLAMGAKARAFALDRFDIARQTELLEGFYDSVLAGAA